MPIPKPKKDESKKNFLSRCMGNDTMVKEYEDEKQRYAICQQQWKDKEKKSMKDTTERRFIVADELEIRADKDGNPTRITGYAAVFNKMSEDLGGFREKIVRGAFAETVKEDDVRMLWNHDSNFVLGRSSAGTLKLEENSKGLKVTNKPPDTQWARDLMVSIGRGDVSQMSFGFRTLKDEWDEEDEDDVVRTLVKVKLLDVSPVSYPAYPQTTVATRAFEDWKEERKQVEDEKADALKEKKERKLRAIKRRHAIRRKELQIKESRL